MDQRPDLLTEYSSSVPEALLEKKGMRKGPADKSEAEFRSTQAAYTDEDRAERLIDEAGMKLRSDQQFEDRARARRMDNLSRQRARQADEILRESPEEVTSEVEGGPFEEVYSTDPRAEFAKNIERHLRGVDPDDPFVREGFADLPTSLRERPDPIPDVPTRADVDVDVEPPKDLSDTTVLSPEFYKEPPPEELSDTMKRVRSGTPPVEPGTTKVPIRVDTQRGPETVGERRKRKADVLSASQRHRQDYSDWVESFPPEKRRLLHLNPHQPDMPPQDRDWLLSMKAQDRWPYTAPAPSPQDRYFQDRAARSDLRNIRDMRALSRQKWRESPEGREARVRQMIRDAEEVRLKRKAVEDAMSEAEQRAYEQGDD